MGKWWMIQKMVIWIEFNSSSACDQYGSNFAVINESPRKNGLLFHKPSLGKVLYNAPWTYLYGNRQSTVCCLCWKILQEDLDYLNISTLPYVHSIERGNTNWLSSFGESVPLDKLPNKFPAICPIRSYYLYSQWTYICKKKIPKHFIYLHLKKMFKRNHPLLNARVRY